MSRVENGMWQPRSECGPRCLPVPGESEVLPRDRQAGRLLGMLGVVLLGVGLLPVLPVLNARGRHLAGRAWARTVLRVLGIRLVARGRLPQRRALLAANHISWLDIVAILAVSPSRMLAKHDVRGWPLFGALAAAAGTIFVDRARPRQLPATVAQVATALRAGGVVTVFPEGTTWCGAARGSVDCGGSGRFRPAMFQAAVDAGAVVVPLTISYRTGVGREGTTAAAFLGDDTLWVSLRRVLAVRELVVSVTATPALHPEAGADRRVLARVAESAVRMSRYGTPTPATAPTPAPALTLVPAQPSPIREPDRQAKREDHELAA